MVPEEINPSINAILAVAVRLEFYRDFQLRLDKWLRENPAMIAQYKATMARIDVERVKWEGELDALSEGVVPISPPTAEEVVDLEEAVKKLSARVAAANANDDFMVLIAEAATALQGDGAAGNA